MVAGGHTHLGQTVLYRCALRRLQGVYVAHFLDRVLPHRAPFLGGSFFCRSGKKLSLKNFQKAPKMITKAIEIKEVTVEELTLRNRTH